MAEHKAEKILENQAHLKAAEGGLPADVQALLDQIESGKLDDPDRAVDLEGMEDYLKEGNFRMVKHKAEGIISAQDNLRAGIPAALQAQIDKAEAEKVDYPDRADDIEGMNDYLANGNWKMVEHKLDDILEAQNNLR